MNTLQIGADSAWFVRAGAAAILFAHIAGGSVGIVSGMTALALRKGGRRHAKAGNIFFVAMIAMTSVGALVAPFLRTRHGDPKWFDSIAALITLYLVVTGWTTVKRKAGTIGRAEIAALGFAASLAAFALLIAIAAASRTTGAIGGHFATDYFVLGGIAALAAAFDARVIRNRGIAGTPRIARHLWRMCAALLVATASFFLGQQRVMPEFMQGSVWLIVPPLAVLAIMVCWLLRFRLAGVFNRFRRMRRSRRDEAAAAVPGTGS